jgi:phage shock protein PspC (stress-responsive transcriptional regulator)
LTGMAIVLGTGLNCSAKKDGEIRGMIMAKRKNRIAQSIIEYVMISTVVFTAVSTVIFYIRRALVVKQRHLAQELNEANR